jgi:hypothetical protein
MEMGQLVEQGTGETFPLGFEPVSIGRHGDNEVILPDPQASRHHAEILMQGGRWIISDLGSANGTYVNGQLVTGPHVLNHGDLIRIGQTQFQVEIAAAMAVQETLVEAAPAREAAPATKERPVWVLPAAGVAAVAILLLGILVLWPMIRGGQDGQQTATPVDTAVAVIATEVGSASPTVRVRPTATAIPTVAPPTRQPTALPATEAPVPATDTPSPSPVIGFFRGQPSTIQRGECTRLEWGEIESASRVTLSEVGSVGTSGKLDVCLDSTKRYTLQATGTGGTAEATVEITVQEPAGPIIEYFRVVPSIISPGNCALLEWGAVENSISAAIEPGIGGVGTPDSLEVCPAGTTTYVLTARNPEDVSVARVTLLVATSADLAPVISFFTANPANIQAGECTTLDWGKVDYATSVVVDNNIGGVGTPGSKEVCLGSTTTFMMTATGPGGTTEREVIVNVSPVQLANLPDLVIESILFAPNPCYRTQKCKVRLNVRNDGPVDAGHFVVRWVPEGQDQVPVEWDVDSLGAGQEKELVYAWIPNRAAVNWQTVAEVDLKREMEEIGEGQANRLEQFITVLEP